LANLEKKVKALRIHAKRLANANKNHFRLQYIARGLESIEDSLEDLSATDQDSLDSRSIDVNLFTMLPPTRIALELLALYSLLSKIQGAAIILEPIRYISSLAMGLSGLLFPYFGAQLMVIFNVIGGVGVGMKYHESLKDIVKRIPLLRVVLDIYAVLLLLYYSFAVDIFVQKARAAPPPPPHAHVE
jgi:hypothetical protein